MHLLAATLVAIVGVNVVPMDSARVLRDQTVIVENARVVTLGPVGSVPVPAGARVIYGNGRWLVPGLIDMHVHAVPMHARRMEHLYRTAADALAPVFPKIQFRVARDRGDHFDCSRRPR